MPAFECFKCDQNTNTTLPDQQYLNIDNQLLSLFCLFKPSLPFIIKKAPLMTCDPLFASQFRQLSSQDGCQSHGSLSVHSGAFELLKPQHCHQRIFLTLKSGRNGKKNKNKLHIVHIQIYNYEHTVYSMCVFQM